MIWGPVRRRRRARRPQGSGADYRSVGIISVRCPDFCVIYSRVSPPGSSSRPLGGGGPARDVMETVHSVRIDHGPVVQTNAMPYAQRQLNHRYVCYVVSWKAYYARGPRYISICRVDLANVQLPIFSFKTSIKNTQLVFIGAHNTITHIKNLTEVGGRATLQFF